MTYKLQTMLFFAACICLLSAKETGCKKTRISDASEAYKPAEKARSAAYLLKKSANPALEKIQTMSAKATVYSEQEGFSISVNTNIIWLRDSAVWVNVKKLGIEAFRVLIKKDSVFVINRLEKTWSAHSLSVLQNEYNLPEGGFRLIQEALLGQMTLLEGVELKSDVQDELHRLSGSDHRYNADYRVEEGSFRLRSESFLQPKDARALTLVFEKYQKLDNAGAFSYLRRIEAFSPETGKTKLDITFNDIEINAPQEYRFSIPGHYRRED